MEKEEEGEGENEKEEEEADKIVHELTTADEDGSPTEKEDSGEGETDSDSENFTVLRHGNDGGEYGRASLAELQEGGEGGWVFAVEYEGGDEEHLSEEAAQE